MRAERIQGLLDDFTAVAERASVTDDYIIEVNARRGIFYNEMLLGRPSHHINLAVLEELLERYPHPDLADGLILDKMHVALIDGRVDDAEAFAREVFHRWRTHGHESDGRTLATGGQLQSAREKLGLGAIVDVVLAAPVPAAEEDRPGVIEGLQALSLASAGRVADARALLERRAGRGFEDLPDDYGLPVALCSWSEAAALTRHHTATKSLLARLRPSAGLHQATGGWYLGATSRYLALLCDGLGDFDAADAWFEQAATEHDVIGSPPWSARSRLDWAESLLRRDDEDRAAALAAHALRDIGELSLDDSRRRALAILGLRASES
jgi:tetratricopeptide (TPR) repeat protein